MNELPSSHRALPMPMRAALWAALTAVFAIPMTAKIIDPAMLWTASDFVVAAVALCVLGALIEIGYSLSSDWNYRIAATGAALGAFLLVWINLAVGFVGDEGNPINLTYFAMLAIVLVGGAITRFRAKAMAALMVFCAIAQVGILVFAMQPMGFEWVATGVFAIGWLGAAALFNRAARS